MTGLGIIDSNTPPRGKHKLSVARYQGKVMPIDMTRQPFSCGEGRKVEEFCLSRREFSAPALGHQPGLEAEHSKTHQRQTSEDERSEMRHE
ncbi:hypothetical protein RRG08_020753 [Elysia crispata]|uniref:Uncharacterized protein n=1 Tax=Elysia crispata TaxID=231223 RepID=A0AAE1AV35_9GAST|nr:hypothetical protein RRG08_020753 [Elysia crispata]